MDKYRCKELEEIDSIKECDICNQMVTANFKIIIEQSRKKGCKIQNIFCLDCYKKLHLPTLLAIITHK
jgi:hypothetical protein